MGRRRSARVSFLTGIRRLVRNGMNNSVHRLVRTQVALIVLLVGVGTTQALGSPGDEAGMPQDPPATGRLRVFLDCTGCDPTYVRQTVDFLDYMRDRTDADVHVLATRQTSGGGGRVWTMRLIGLGRFEGHDHTYEFATPQAATSDEQRREFTRVFKLALVDYLAETETLDELDVTWRPPPSDAPAVPQDDPWNYWVFRTSASGSSSGEQRSSSRSYRFSFSANRVTEQWKITLSTNTSTSKSTFEIDEETTVDSNRDSWSFSNLVVKSLGPKWSFGNRVSISHSSFSNTDRSISFAPGIEFDFFPYAESTQRSLTVLYTVGLTRYDYRELTLYDKLSEEVPVHALNVSLGLRQPWGTLSAYARYSQHLNHTERYSATVLGSTNIRLFRGFSFNVLGTYSKINDQISLQKGDATRDEVLLRLRQLATDYSYRLSFGFTYSFGSIFNSVVNPRFGGGGVFIGF